MRLESTEVMVYGTVDAKKMWAEYQDEAFTPILVGDRAVVAVWFNNFLDTDCGGSYLETWYNTFVTRKEAPVCTSMPRVGRSQFCRSPLRSLFYSGCSVVMRPAILARRPRPSTAAARSLASPSSESAILDSSDDSNDGDDSDDCDD